MAKKITKAALRKQLKTMDQKELSDLVLELYSNCPIVKERLSFQFLGEEYAEEELKKRKELLFKTFYSRNYSYEKIETIMRDFKNVCGNTYWYGELALYYINLVKEYAVLYVSHDNKYFVAMRKAFVEVTKIASQEKSWFDQWKEDMVRILDIYSEYNIDGYDEMVDCYYSIPWLDNEALD